MQAPEEGEGEESSAALALPPAPRTRRRATPKAAAEKDDKDEAEDSSSTSSSSSSSSSSEDESAKRVPDTKTPEKPKAPQRPPGLEPTHEPEVFDPTAASSTADRPMDVETQSLVRPNETPSSSAPATWLTVQSGDWIQGSKEYETRKRLALQEPTELIADAKRYRVNVDTLEVKVDHLMAEVRDLEGWRLLQEDGENEDDLWEEPALIPKYSKAWDPVELSRRENRSRISGEIPSAGVLVERASRKG